MNHINNKINYSYILEKYPWIVNNNSNCIISPDSDGFLCGLLMTNYLNSNVVGFYDGKVLLLQKGLSAKDCIFLDIDINRNNIKSIGHHMVLYNKNKKLAVPNFNYDFCIQPNIMRNFDYLHDFQSKYPFATIHLLLSILSKTDIKLELANESIWPLLFTDGVWNNLFSYTENCLNWIKYLRINEKTNLLNKIFCLNDRSFYEIMKGLNKFLRIRDKYNSKGYLINEKYKEGGRAKRTGDKLRLSNSKGTPINIIKNNKYMIFKDERNRIKGFIKEMSNYIKWYYLPSKWKWTNFELYQFSKSDFNNRRKNLNGINYIDLMENNPLSLAMTSGSNIEYTLEKPDKLP